MAKPSAAWRVDVEMKWWKWGENGAEVARAGGVPIERAGEGKPNAGRQDGGKEERRGKAQAKK